MKSYPSMVGASKAPHQACYGFVKYDGSSIRAAWSPKRGWYKFGTRKLMIDESSQYFGTAIPLFKNKYGDRLERIFKKEKHLRNCQEITVFCEWFGPSSFAGQHKMHEAKDIVLFDVNLHKKGFIGPKEFIDTFSEVPIAELIYQGNLNDELIQQVRNGTFDCVSKYAIKNLVPEGIVCKGGRGEDHSLWMAKVKTQVWFDALKVHYPTDWEKMEQEDV